MKIGKGEPLVVGSATVPFAESLSQIFGEHHRRVLRAAYRITGNMADAEDVAQLVFLRLAGAHGQVTNPGSYLYRAAINGALDLLRSRKNARTEPLERASNISTRAAGTSPEDAVGSRELGGLLRTAIGELPPRAAEMFILRYVEELGNRAIATMLGTSQAVVAVTLHHARRRLKKRLLEFGRGRL